MASCCKSYRKVIKGNDYYPGDMMEEYNLLINYKTSHSNLVEIMVDES